MNKKMRIGVLGAGYWGRKLIGEYLHLQETRDDVELAAVADPSLQMLESLREAHPEIPRLISEPQVLLEDPTIDAVHISVPNELHHETARAAFRAGKHVLLEKPLTLESRQAYDLVEEAGKSGRVFHVGHIFQFNNAIALARKMVRNGDLGRIYSVRLRWSSVLDPLPQRDILFDLAPHPVDIATNILGEWPHKVTARGKSYVRGLIGREEEAIAVLEFPDGKAAVIEVSWISPGEKVREVFVRGSSATLRIDALNQTIKIYKGNGGEEETIPVKANNTIRDEVTSFIDHIITGDGESINGAYIGAKTVETIEAMRRSILDERTIYLDEIRHSDSKQEERVVKIQKSTIGLGTRVLDFANLYGCTIGEGVKIDSYVYIEEGVTIGDRSKIRAGAFLPTGVAIGREVFVGPGVVFTNDRRPKAQGDWTLERIVVEDGASIGAGAIILPGITIGEGALVGAGSVVTKDVPPFAVVAGNPARVLPNPPSHPDDEIVRA